MKKTELRKIIRESIKDLLREETQLNMFRKLTPELRKKLDSEYDDDWELSQHPDKKEKFYDLLITYVPDRKLGSFKNAAAKLFGFDNVSVGSNDGEMLEWFYNFVQDNLEGDTLFETNMVGNYGLGNPKEYLRYMNQRDEINEDDLITSKMIEETLEKNLEKALYNWVKYSRDKGDSESDVRSILNNYVKDAIIYYNEEQFAGEI